MPVSPTASAAAERAVGRRLDAEVGVNLGVDGAAKEAAAGTRWGHSGHIIEDSPC